MKAGPKQKYFTPRKTISANIDETTFDELMKLVDFTGASKSELIAAAIAEYLKQKKEQLRANR